MMNAGLVSVPVDPHLFDGPTISAHPVHDAGPLEGRSGRARAGDEPLRGAEHHLPVRAHVEEEGRLLRGAKPGGQHPGGDVRPDVGGDAGQGIDRAVGIDGDAHLLGPEQRRLGDQGR